MYPFSPTTDADSILKWMTGLLDSSKYTTIVSEDFDEEDQKPVTDTHKKISPAPAVSQPIPIKTRSTVSRARIATGPSAPVINKKPKSVVNRYPPSKPVAKTTKPVIKTTKQSSRRLNQSPSRRSQPGQLFCFILVEDGRIITGK